MEKKTLKEIRQRQELDQTQLSIQSNMRQPAVSAVERSSNMHVSTIKKYLNGMGFDLKLVAVYPYGEYEIVLPEPV